MKLLFDLFPVILFFAAYKLADIYVATGVVIAATFVQIGWVWWRHGKVDKILWISLGLVVVFGGATLVLHDELFIKWKLTILDWLFAVVLFVSAKLFDRNLIRGMMEEQISLPAPVWNQLNLAWCIFFALMGAANLVILLNYPTEVWVNFKVFGTIGLMLAFMLAQGIWLAKHIKEEEQR
jgi:intracellular septation protein